MNRKTQSLYHSVFATVKRLLPAGLNPTHAMADFEDASVSAFREVFGGNIAVSGCWFHFSQAIIKRLQKVGLKDAYAEDSNVKDVVRCIIALPLLPAPDIAPALQDVRGQITNDMNSAHELQKLVTYVDRQWLLKRTIGADRLSVRDNRWRTNIVLESYHASLRRCIQVGFLICLTML